MINIAICDDNIIFCSELEDTILKYGNKNCLDFNIEIFYSGKDFLNNNDNTYDILFLDIEMDILNGIDIGKKIRNEIKNEEMKIVYVSAHKDYAMELFEIRPFNFLIKPIDEGCLIKTLDKIIDNLKLKVKNFIYKIGHEYKKEVISNIIYFESQGRMIKMTTLYKTIIFYGNLKEICKELEKYNFLSPHKSYLVNYAYIKLFEYEQLVLINDEIVPIGKTKRKLIRNLHIEKEDG